jgi:hypothetical protein
MARARPRARRRVLGRGPAVEEVLQQVPAEALALCLKQALGLQIRLRGVRRRDVDVANDDRHHRQRRRARLIVGHRLQDRLPEHLVVEPEGVHEVPERDSSHASGRHGPDEEQLLGCERALPGQAAQERVVVLVDVVPHVRQEGRIVDARIGGDLRANRRDAPVDELFLAIPERGDDPHDGRRSFGGDAHLGASLMGTAARGAGAEGTATRSGGGRRDGRPLGRPPPFSAPRNSSTPP